MHSHLFTQCQIKRNIRQQKKVIPIGVTFFANRLVDFGGLLVRQSQFLLQLLFQQEGADGGVVLRLNHGCEFIL